MRRYLTIRGLLTFIATGQIIALWLWGLLAFTWGAWGYTLATLLLSTLWIMWLLAVADREAKP